MTALIQTEACFRQLADVFPQLVWTVDAAGRLSFGNHTWRERTTIAEGQLFAEPFSSAIHPEDRQRWRDTWRRALDSHFGYDIETRVCFEADGDYVRQLEHGRPIHDRRGRVVEWLMIATSPNDNERQIADLQRSVRAANQFPSLVAHEMRSPLAAISTALAALELRALDPAAAASAGAIIARQTAQLTRLIGDLFDFAKLEHGQIELHTNHVDLAVVVARSVEAAQPVIGSRKHALTVEIHAEPAVVLGDEGRLVQVLTNLLVNAAKYTEDPGHIWLVVDRDPPWLLVKVRDTGIGIPRGMLPDIFHPYVRVEHQRSAPAGGLGLGLALARKFVELHRGTLSAHSDGPGRGSEFVVRLPDPEWRPQSPAPQPPAREHARSRAIQDRQRANAAGGEQC